MQTQFLSAYAHFGQSSTPITDTKALRCIDPTTDGAKDAIVAALYTATGGMVKADAIAAKLTRMDHPALERSSLRAPARIVWKGAGFTVAWEVQ